MLIREPNRWRTEKKMSTGTQDRKPAGPRALPGPGASQEELLGYIADSSAKTELWMQHIAAVIEAKQLADSIKVSDLNISYNSMVKLLFIFLLAILPAMVGIGLFGGMILLALFGF